MKKFKIMVCGWMLLIFSVPASQAGKIKDGCWNGKPWKKEVLEKGVEAGDAGALAEWAYCSYNSRLGIRYDTKKMFSYARKAADKGSALGVYMLGHFYETGCGVEQEIVKYKDYFIKAKDMGHPLGKWKVNVFKRKGKGGMKQDLTNVVENMEKSLDEGVERAYASLAAIYRDGDTGEVDLEKAAKYLSDGLNKTQNMSVVMMVCGLGRNSGLMKHLSEKDLAIAYERLDKAADLGNVFCRFVRVMRTMDQGRDIHKHIQECIEIVNLDYSERREMSTPELIHQRLLRAVIFGLHYRDVNDVDMNYHDFRILAGICYRGNTDGEFVRIIHAEGMLQMKNGRLEGRAPAKDEAVAVDILRQVAARDSSDHRPHHMLGDYFCRKYMQWDDVDRKEFDRGMAHNIYHSKCPFAAFQVAEFYLTGNKAKDLAKGKAAGEWAIQVNSGWYKNRIQQHLKQIEKEITEGQKKEAERLQKEGFPYHDTFRKEAFELLKKIGDLPEDATFDGKDEETSIEMEEEELLGMVQMMISMPEIYAGTVGAYKDARAEVLEMYWRGNKLSKAHLKLLVIMFMDEKGLASLLDTYNEGEFAKKAREMKSLIGQGYKVNPNNSNFPAQMGWYLTMEKEKVVPHPLVTRLIGAEGGQQGLRKGDVLISLYGASLKGNAARNAFMTLTQIWPREYPLELKVIRNHHAHEHDHNIPKTAHAEVKLKLKE